MAEVAHHALVQRIARGVHRRGSCPVPIEDLVQTGFLALAAAAPLFRDEREESFTRYLQVRLRGAMIDEIRRQTGFRRGHRGPSFVHIDAVSESHPEIVDPVPPACDRLAWQQMRHLLRDAISGLPAPEGLVVQLYHIEEFSLAEIGRLLEVSAARICQIRRSGERRLQMRFRSRALI